VEVLVGLTPAARLMPLPQIKRMIDFWQHEEIFHLKKKKNQLGQHMYPFSMK